MPGLISTGRPRLATAWAAAARSSSLNASRFARAAARSSAFEAADIRGRQIWRHHPIKRMIQYSRALVLQPRGCGVLDTPLSRGITAVLKGTDGNKLIDEKIKVRSRNGR